MGKVVFCFLFFSCYYTLVGGTLTEGGEGVFILSVVIGFGLGVGAVLSQVGLSRVVLWQEECICKRVGGGDIAHRCRVVDAGRLGGGVRGALSTGLLWLNKIGFGSCVVRVCVLCEEGRAVRSILTPFVLFPLR